MAILNWKQELEKVSVKYHIIGAWAAIIFDPIFSVTDYFNIPESWVQLLYIRLGISVTTLVVLYSGLSRNWPSFVIVLVPFTLISLQNAYTFALIGPDDILGHCLNYIALLIGAAMFLLWSWRYSVAVLVISALATAFFLSVNDLINLNEFFVRGGLLLGTVSVFMVILINTRYDLTIREIKARLALEVSNEEIRAQELVIKRINENLEHLVQVRTQELKTKNGALEEAAFINAHKLRSPVASILGLTNILLKTSAVKSEPEVREMVNHLEQSTLKLDEIVKSIRATIEKAEGA